MSEDEKADEGGERKGGKDGSTYPGEGIRMSVYGLKTYTAEQEKEQWRENVRREFRINKNHFINSGKSADVCNTWKVNFSRYFKGEQPLQNISYFNTGKKSKALSIYDRTFHIEEGYCSKLRRDDRQHSFALDIYSEECKKDVPTLTSSQYGRRPALETPSRKHCRVLTVKRDFYRESGAHIMGKLSMLK
ncbi:uncharacterized protein LOC116292756 [Actinia tenebrosa]|uniref:Uncharacterized protein LOC116292756 n=1 Tax=Actinia tenebrosa TaxID=6105 RepID=A0A6P8HLX7_ACTTE|nr:uncharacterized protein LOC116292756 [Actinia tenebrosa]